MDKWSTGLGNWFLHYLGWCRLLDNLGGLGGVPGIVRAG